MSLSLDEVPDSWDSEEEEKTGRKRPDVFGAQVMPFMGLSGKCEIVDVGF